MKVTRLIAPLLCALATTAGAQTILCPAFQHAYGPFDYRSVAPDHLNVVEVNHFTPEVEQLIAGKSGYIGDDLDYTLRAIPNHPRALLAMMRWAKKNRTDTPKGAKANAECYFQEAIKLYPNDGTAHLLFALYLIDQSKSERASKEIDIAAKLNHDSMDANVHYNMGLAYFDLKQYDNALASAQKAYELGFPLLGLKTKLQSVGKWQEEAPKASAP